MNDKTKNSVRPDRQRHKRVDRSLFLPFYFFLLCLCPAPGNRNIIYRAVLTMRKMDSRKLRCVARTGTESTSAHMIHRGSQCFVSSSGKWDAIIEFWFTVMLMMNLAHVAAYVGMQMNHVHGVRCGRMLRRCICMSRWLQGPNIDWEKYLRRKCAVFHILCVAFVRICCWNLPQMAELNSGRSAVRDWSRTGYRKFQLKTSELKA